MAAGSQPRPFTSAERARLDAAMRTAEQTSRAEFSLFVGRSRGDAREFATSLHASLTAPERSVLIMLDPEERLVEVVTGPHVRRTLSDRQTQLAVATMTSHFRDDDLVGGLRAGILQLGEHARPQRTLHAGKPA
ncbi:hypothetical protein GCM10023340_38270 [Nocardioides marinquilinus]|uniref:DUF5130 family protein n=1 Tax=Nocardioides marinquilinus TaxID=1210400 RepID=A0ABP9Q1I0_9ACTN